jgi:DNA polymerase-1
MVLGWLLNKGVGPRQSLALKPLAQHYLGAATPLLFEDVVGEDGDCSLVHPQDLAEYAANDARYTAALWALWRPELRADDRLERVYERLESPLVPVLQELEARGVLLDVPWLVGELGPLQEGQAALADEFLWLTGVGVTRAAELSKVGYGASGWWSTHGLAKGAAGRYSVNKATLEHHRAACPQGSLGRAVATLKLDYQLREKIRTTYLPALISSAERYPDRRHRPDFIQHGTHTGRFSSGSRLLTMPRGELRRCVIAPPGHQIICADYSQIELRILAHLSRDAGLLEAFQKGQDPHGATAARLGCSRQTAKVINFLLVYGGGPRRLASVLGIRLEEARGIFNAAHAAMPGILAFTKRAIADAHDTGYSRTLLGHRRPVLGLEERDFRVRGHAERIAANTPIQGTAAGIIKLAMVRLAASDCPAKMLFQVHDELVFECPTDQVGVALPQVKAIMEGALKLAVPLVVEPKAGPNWLEAKA